ncbi:MAG: hypothetical protein UEL26_05830 [Segatella copri]|nr:hypothetical protein [Segatella copri]
MKNIPIIRKIYDFEFEVFKTYNESSVDFAALILAVARKILDASSRMEVLNIDKAMEPFLLVEVGKNSRANIFISSNKYVSISFPFNIKYKQGYVKLYIDKHGTEIRSDIISECLSIMNELKHNATFVDVWFESDNPYSEMSLRTVEYLLHSEPCYLRYDYDMAKANGSLHPVHHLDINMTKGGHYKIGLHKKLSHKQFLDILNIETNCYYLSPITVNTGLIKRKIGKRRK